MRQPKIVLVFIMSALILCGLGAESAGIDFWSDTFLGVSWDLAGSFSDKSITLSKAQIDDLSFFFTYGNRRFPGIFPLRGRVGIGWWKGEPWVISLGLELPLYESLSSSQARHFGIYLFGDGHFRFPVSADKASFEPSLRLLIPLTAAGGVALGAGYDTAMGPTWHVEFMSGAYVVR